MRKLIYLWLVLLALISIHPVCGKKKKRRAKGEGSNGVPASREAHLHYQQGVMAHVQGDFETAKRMFRLAISAQPDFAYAYFRLGFVLQEQRQAELEGAKRGREKDETNRASNTLSAAEDPIKLFQVAVGIDGSDEMVYHALGEALRSEGRLEEASHTYLSVATRLNPKSAHAYWGLGKVAALSVDEFDSDPEDPNDPSHFYELAAKLKPDEFQPDGTRVRRVPAQTPEREAKLEEEAKLKREQFVKEIKSGERQMKVAGESSPTSVRANENGDLVYNVE